MQEAGKTLPTSIDKEFSAAKYMLAEQSDMEVVITTSNQVTGTPRRALVSDGSRHMQLRHKIH